MSLSLWVMSFLVNSGSWSISLMMQLSISRQGVCSAHSSLDGKWIQLKPGGRESYMHTYHVWGMYVWYFWLLFCFDSRIGVYFVAIVATTWLARRLCIQFQTFPAIPSQQCPPVLLSLVISCRTAIFGTWLALIVAVTNHLHLVWSLWPIYVPYLNLPHTDLAAQFPRSSALPL